MDKDLIERVEIRNVRCLRHVDVELAPLTVLIGKNDTGKTSFLDAISWLAWASGGRKEGVSAHTLVTTAVPHEQASVAVIHSRHGRMALPLNVQRPQLQFNALQSVAPPYRLDPAQLRAPAQVGILRDCPLPPGGNGLVDVIDRLPLSKRIVLQTDFLERIPTVAEVRPDRPESGQTGVKELWFDVKGAGVLPARQMSDGAMLLLAYLAIIHDKNAPRLIMIEEPENGIHPKQLEYVVQMLASLTERDEPVQVIITTHSPYVLDFVPRDAVRVFSRGPDGNVSVEAFHSFEGISDMLSKGMTLGEAWYNADEDDLVKRD